MLHLIYLTLFVTFINSTKCTTCYCLPVSSLCARLCGRKSNQVHPQNQDQVYFDNSLSIVPSSNATLSNITLSRIATASELLAEFGASLASRSYPSSLRSRSSSQMSALSITNVTDIKWFEIDSKFIIQNNKTAENTNIILTNTISYTITHKLYFIAHYLPLYHVPNAKQFKRVFDVFARFQNGANHVDLRKLMDNFGAVCDELLDIGNLWQNMKEVEENINHMFGYDNNSTRSSIRNRQIAAKCMRSVTHDDKEHFWKTNWLKWCKEPLDFIGIQPHEREQQIRMMLLLLKMNMASLQKVIIGNDDYFKPLKIQAKVIKAGHVSVVNFFRINNVTIEFGPVAPKLYLKMRSLSAKQTKLAIDARHLMSINVLKYLVKLSSLAERTFVNPHANKKVKIVPLLLPHNVRRLHIYFNSKQWFGEHSLWDDLLQMSIEYMMILLNDPDLETVIFTDIYEDGVFFLLHVVLGHAKIGGRCGYTHNDESTQWTDSIFCDIPLSEINKEGKNVRMDKHFKIPHFFLTSRNDTNGTDTQLNFKILSVVEFKDIDDARSDDLD